MADISNIDLVYHGLHKPTAENFRPLIPNNVATKCEGGLWTSPILDGETKSEWHKWCEEAQMGPAPHRWHIIPDKNCHILVVQEDLMNLRGYIRKGKSIVPYILDYEKIAQDYDALYVPDKVQRRYQQWNQLFNGYDVESCLFFRPKYQALTDEEYKKYRTEHPVQKDKSKGNMTDKEIVLLMKLQGILKDFDK